MLTLKGYCEKNNIDINKCIDLCIGDGGTILPKFAGYTGYIVELHDTYMTFVNDKLEVKKDIPFSSFQRAEFGIGSGNLWLQCIVDGSELVFCTTRGKWKSPAAKLMLEKIEEHTEILGWKEYKGFTGKLFLLYLFK